MGQLLCARLRSTETPQLSWQTGPLSSGTSHLMGETEERDEARKCPVEGRSGAA